MTEKNYGGAAPFRKQGKSGIDKKVNLEVVAEKSKKVKKESDSLNLEKQKILKAGKIASQVRKYIKEITRR